jgi:acetate kinase
MGESGGPAGPRQKRNSAVGHRIVHGGADHIDPALVTPALLRDLEALTPLDSLHMLHNLAPIRTIVTARPAQHDVRRRHSHFRGTHENITFVRQSTQQGA